MTGRTTLIIAHRLSTISLADRVAVVEGGRVIAEGTHAELLATEPRYAEILAQSRARTPTTRRTDAEARRAERATRLARARDRRRRRRAAAISTRTSAIDDLARTSAAEDSTDGLGRRRRRMFGGGADGRRGRRLAGQPGQRAAVRRHPAGDAGRASRSCSTTEPDWPTPGPEHVHAPGDGDRRHPARACCGRTGAC